MLNYKNIIILLLRKSILLIKSIFNYFIIILSRVVRIIMIPVFLYMTIYEIFVILIKTLFKYYSYLFLKDISYKIKDKFYDLNSKSDKRVKLIGKYDDIISIFNSFKKSEIFFEYTQFKYELVYVKDIIGTDHSDYSSYYDINETGTFLFNKNYFPGKRRDPGEGYKNYWFPNKENTDLVQLKKHPTLNKYYVAGDGNHRVMASKLKKDAPEKLFAFVSHATWNKEALFIFYICSFGFYNYDFEVLFKPNYIWNSIIYFSIVPTYGAKEIHFMARIDKKGIYEFDLNEFKNKLKYSTRFKFNANGIPDSNWWANSFINIKASS